MHENKTQRLVGVDTSRGVALVGMIITHIMPLVVEGTLTFAAFFAGRASALFAVLAGISLVLSTRGIVRTPGIRSWLLASLTIYIRAVCIGVLGLFLGSLDHTLAIILVYYAGMFLVAPAFLRLPAAVLASLALGWMVLAPILSHVIRHSFSLERYFLDGSFGDLASPTLFLQELIVTGYYPVLPWMSYILVGMCLAKLPWRRATRRTAILVAGAGITFACISRLISMFLLDAGGRSALYESLQLFPLTDSLVTPDMAQHYVYGGLPFALNISSYGVTPSHSWWWLVIAGPHSATPFDLLHTAGIACTVIALCMLFCRVHLGQSLALIFALPGAMPLSVYTGHVVLLATTQSFLTSAPVALTIHLAAVFTGPWLWVLIRRGTKRHRQQVYGQGCDDQFQHPFPIQFLTVRGPLEEVINALLRRVHYIRYGLRSRL